MKRLRGVEEALATFFASGPVLLGERLGPFLWQLPERTAFEPDVLADFLGRLPRTVAEAAATARHETGRVRERFGEDPWRRAAPGTADRALRHALEVRHETFRSAEFFALCREHDVAVVVSDGAGRWPVLDEVTSDHVYVRLHGGEELYTSGYGPQELDRWAERVRGWCAEPGGAAGAGAFDNDAKVHAPYDAVALAERLGVDRPGDPTVCWGEPVTTRGLPRLAGCPASTARAGRAEVHHGRTEGTPGAAAVVRGRRLEGAPGGVRGDARPARAVAGAAGTWGTMRLTVVGRRSGEERSVILGYLEDGPDLVTLAMNGWAAPEPAWWLNLAGPPRGAGAAARRRARGGGAPGHR